MNKIGRIFFCVIQIRNIPLRDGVILKDAGNIIKVQQTISYDISSDLSFLVRVHLTSGSNKIDGALKEKEKKKRERKEGSRKGE